MKNVLLKLIAIAAIPVAGMSIAQADRPAAVPPNYVITPFGYYHPSCVVKLAHGDELQPDKQVVTHPNGTTNAMHVCAYPHYKADGEAVTGEEPGVHAQSAPNISHSWIVAESTSTTSSYAFLSAEWTVPPNPASNDGQTLYFFPGMEDYQDVVTIIQPVLGWNSDYKNAWGIASWNCCENGTVYESTPQPVNPGDTILGYIFDTCAGGTLTCTSWDIVTMDLQSGKFSQLLKTSNFKQTFNWAFGGVLEVYNIKQCSDYPNNWTGWSGGGHSISFNEIVLTNDNFQPINPAWTLDNWSGGLTPQCSYGGSNPAQVILNYGTGNN